MKLIGLAGPAGVGKDTIADYLVATHGFTKFSFSDALYEEVAAAFGIDKAALYVRETKEQPMEALQYFYCENMDFKDVMWDQLRTAGAKYPMDVWCSPRQVLQWWGTEYRRKQDPEYWIKQAAMVVEAYLRNAAASPDVFRGGMVNCSVRFPNERVFVEQYNGEVWHVQRPNWDKALGESTKAHVAEQGLSPLPQDKIVLNNGTIEQLGTAATLLLGAKPGSIVKCGISTYPDAVVCTKCGLVYTPLTRGEAEAEVNQYNAMMVQHQGRADPETLVHVEDYEGCERCDSKTFRPVESDETVKGAALRPVIYEPDHEPLNALLDNATLVNL